MTISQAQYDFARARIARAGLQDRVEIRLQDYRQIEGRFDKIVSIEMMEALGDRYLETFLAKSMPAQARRRRGLPIHHRAGLPAR